MGKYLRSQSRNLSQRPDIMSCYPSGSTRTPVILPLLNAREWKPQKCATAFRPNGSAERLSCKSFGTF